MALSKALIISSVVPGTAITATTAAYCQTRETAWEQISNDAIPPNSKDNSLENIWSKLKENLTKNLSHITQEELKSIQKDNTSDASTKLKNWCFKNYALTYKYLGIISMDKNLFSDIKIACELKIQDKLTEQEKLDVDQETNAEEFKKNLKALKDHSDPNISLHPKLSQLQEKAKSSDDNEAQNWKGLRDWCKEAYGRGYQGNNSPLWKQVDKFCKKTN